MTDRGDERIGDTERQHVIDLLRTHTGAGRLTLDEFSDLAGDVFAARTRAELDRLLDGLPPGVTPHQPPEPVAVPLPAEQGGGPPAGPVRRRRRLISIMSAHHTKGRWRAPDEITAFTFWGAIKVDLRSAVIQSPVVDIYAWAIMGAIEVIVPPGILVEHDGMVVMGGNENRTRDDTPIEGAPVVRVHARGLWGAVMVRNPRDRSRHRHGHHGLGHGATAEPADGVAPATDREERARPFWCRPAGLPGPPGPEWLPPLPVPDGLRVPRSRSRGRSYDRGNGNGVPARDGVTATNEAAAAAATGPRGTLTMMVTDIVGSTRLAEVMGDRRWMEVLGSHNDLVRGTVAEHGGTVVKTQGDGFLVVFSSARSAILASVDIQRKLASQREDRPEHGIDLRIGLHTGEIVDVDGDVFGQNVVVAVRIADHAGPGEILVSGMTRDLTQAGGDLDFDSGRELDLKGLSQPWRVHRVTWTTAPA